MKKIFFMLFIFFIGLNTAEAHVRYLINNQELEANRGFDLQFLLDALTPLNITLIIATLVAGLIFFGITKLPPIKNLLSGISKRADNYSMFTPWIMRCSLGIALIGAGVTHTVVSPVLQGYVDFSFIQILVGFFLVAGFMVIPSTLVAIGIYAFAFLQDWYILGNLDFLALAISLLILDNEKPGLDDLLGFPKISPFRFLKRYVPLVLRFGIGGAMMFLAVYEKILNPHISELIVNNFGLLNVINVSPEMWVLGAGIIEFVIGFTLFVGWFTRVSSAIAFVVLSLSFFYFGEDVASHITLFGNLAVLFITRGGIWSIDCRQKRVNYEFTC